MAASLRRTVISGIGLLNALGSGAADVWDGLVQGRSGIAPISRFDASGLPVRFAGEMATFDAKTYLDKKDRRSLKMMARTIELAVAAAQVAMNDGNVDKTKLDPTRFGVEFGSGLIALELPEIGEAAARATSNGAARVDMASWGREGIPAVQPLWMLRYLPNMPACHVSIMHDAQGPNNTITESDASGLLALGEADRIIERDSADFFLVGAAESKINPLSIVRQCLFEPLSRRNDAPQHACRPFDRNRDGLVLGEGAAVLVVEELEHAKKRGARIYAEMVGFGAAFDVKKNGDGIARAVRAALKEAGIGPNDVDHIAAHGLGAIDSDVWEARGLASVFGSPTPPVLAAKAAIGNLGSAAGLTELAMSVLALHHGRLPGTLNHEHPDPACPVAVHVGPPRPTRSPFAMKIAFTPMGQCVAVVIRKMEPHAA